VSNKHKVVITGANGFVGSNLVKHCLDKGCEVTGLVRSAADLSLLPTGYPPVKIDYRDDSALKTVLSGQEILVHNAAITRGRNWEQFRKHNIELTSRLVNIANETGSLRQFIFISSQAAAGICRGLSGKKEDEECFPVSNYGKSKLFAEEEIQRNCRKNWTIVRPASVFGEGDSDFLQYFKLVKKGITPVLGFRTKYISLISISCLVDFIYRTFSNPRAYNEIFFSSCSSHYSMEEFTGTLEKAMKKRTIRIRIPEFLVYPAAVWGEIKGKISRRPSLLNLQKLKEMKSSNWICDPGKAKEVLGFDEHLDLSEALRKTYNWYKEKGWL